MSQENVETVRRAVEAWNRGDMEAYVAFFHPDCEWFSAVARQIEGDEALVRGRKGMRQFWEEWHSVWDLTILALEYRDLGDTVLMLGRMTTRGKTSRIEVDGPVAYVAENEQGLIRKLRAYRDHAEALEAVGLSQQDAHADS